MTRAKAPKRSTNRRQGAARKPKVTSLSRRQLEDLQDLKAARRARRQKGTVPLRSVLDRIERLAHA